MARYCPIKDGPALYPDCGECEEKACEKFFCLVVGSRTFSDDREMERKLDQILRNKAPHVVIVSGGARGADQCAERYAKRRGYQVIVFPAKWEQGKSAGYIRNKEMHAFLSKQKERGVVAFWDGKSKGTQHSFALAKQFGNPLRVIRTSGGEP